MSTTRTTNSISGTVPQLGDAANIETAFNNYHDSLANTSTGVAALNRANDFTGNIAINNGTSTELTTTGTTAALFNTNATTLNIGGAAATLTIGATTGTATIRNATVAITNAATIGTTLSVTGNTTLTGDLAVNGGDLTSSASTFNLLASPATVNIAAAGTAVSIGASTGTTTVKNDLLLAASKQLAFEGSSTDSYQTFLTVTNPTADRTITLPNDSGYVVLDTATQTLTNKTLTSPDINAGTADSLTSLSIRDTSAAYDVKLAATSSTALTAGRTLTLDVVNAARTLKLGANVSVNAALTINSNAVTIAGASGGSSVTLPSSGTLATLTGSETLTNKTLTAPIISTISNSGTITLPTGTRTLVARDTTDTLTNKTITLAGSAGSVAPLTFTTGTKVSPIANGTVEYDGNLFFATPKVNNTTAGRGLLQTEYSLVTIADNTQTVSGTGNTDFYALNKSIYLAASQAYFVEMSIRIYHNLTYTGNGSGSATFLLKGPTGVSYKIDAQSQVGMANLTDTDTPEFKHISSTSASRSIASPGGASDAGYSIFKWSGIVYISSTAGNFGPAINLVATSSGSPYTSSFTVQAGSYCKVTPLGTYASEINHGGWA